MFLSPEEIRTRTLVGKLTVVGKLQSQRDTAMTLYYIYLHITSKSFHPEKWIEVEDSHVSNIFSTRQLCKDDVHHPREVLGSAGSQRGRLGSDVSGRSRAGSDASAGEDHVKRTHSGQNHQDNQLDSPGTMKDSIIAAASKSELPSVRWPALSILLELAWDEEHKMSLINCNVPESWQQDARSHGNNSAANHFICVSSIYSFNMFQLSRAGILSHLSHSQSDSAFFTLPISQGASCRSFAR